MITYNHAPFIVKAIDGVLHQKTNFLFELIIGEDWSTDGTRDIVLEYQKKFPEIIRVITSDENVGMKQNSYRTMKACRGKYIAYCEGDDYWHNPLKLQKQVDYLNDHPECGLVYSSYDVYLVESGKLIKDYKKYRNVEPPENPCISDLIEKWGVAVGIVTCTVMMRRNLCEELSDADPYLHQSNHFLMGDTQLWAETATKSNLHYIPDSLATYNISAESASRSKHVIKSLRFSISCSELFLYLCKKYDLSPSIREEHEDCWCDSSLRLAVRTRNQDLAAKVRNIKKTFSLKEWLRYLGACNILVHYTYRASVSLLNLFRKERNRWI